MHKLLVCLVATTLLGSATNAAAEVVTFPATEGRFVRLKALSEINGNPWSSMAEIDVFQESDVLQPEVKPSDDEAVDERVLMGPSERRVASPIDVSSPDGRIGVSFAVRAIGGTPGSLSYSLIYQGQPLIADAALGMTVQVLPVEGPALAGSAALEPVPKGEWKLVRVDSQSSGCDATRAFDGNPGTIWHTQWQANSPRHPHEIVIDLGRSYRLAGFAVTPRHDESPNGTIKDYEFYVGGGAGDFGRPVAKGRFRAAEADAESWSCGFEIVEVTRTTNDTTWNPLYGQWSTIRDHYNQAAVKLRQSQAPHRYLQLVLRVYDGGAAFSYTIPQQPGAERVAILKEATEFRFPAEDGPALRQPMAATGFRRVDPGGTTTGELPPRRPPPVSAGLIPAGPQLVSYHHDGRHRFPPG